MSESHTVAVIGATGMLGIPVTRALVEAGFTVTALVRNPVAAKRVLPPEVALVEADVRDEDSLRRGLAGQDALYLNLAVQPGERRNDFHTEVQGLEHILNATHAAGIKRIGYLSALVIDSADGEWWVLDVWRAAVQRLKSCGIPATIFYASNFMETLPQRHRLGSALVLAGTSHHANYWIAADDFGRQVARAFAMPETAGRDYVIQGPELVTYEEAAERYVRAKGDGLRVVKLPLALLRFLGLFSTGIRFNARILRTVLRYPEEFKAEETWRDLGKPATTIEAFAKAGG
ncbi:MAG TPA: NmrA family NAD(P)-binding protein [Hyphomicrobium sp.]